MFRPFRSATLATLALCALVTIPRTSADAQAQPTARDTAIATQQKIATDSLARSVAPALRQYCATKGAAGYVKTACPIFTRQLTALQRAESALVAATVVPPTPPTPSPSPTDTGFAVFAASDFESGTITPFFDPWAGIYPAADLAVVPDPTNSGHGNVLKIHYYNDPANNWFDNNHAVSLDPSDPARQITYGDEVMFDGDLYIQKGATDSLVSATGLRKLNYWCSNDTDWSTNTPQNHFCFVLSTQANGPGHPSGDEQLQWNLSLAATQPGSAVTIPLQYSYTGVFLTENRWHHVQIRMRLNSSPTTQDGAFTMTLDGSVFVSRSDLWFVDPSWGPTQQLQAYDWRIGYQLNATAKVDETRYWDNLRFAAKRAHPLTLAARRSRPRIPLPHYPRSIEGRPKAPTGTPASTTRIPVRKP